MNAHPLAGKKALRMNGLGNEIVVLDLRGIAAQLSDADARAIGRAEGLHFDQLMVLGDSTEPGVAATMKIFNIDGSLSGACGNGTRCVAWALAREGETGVIRLRSDAGLLEAWRESEFVFTVDMGAPQLDWRAIPLAQAAEDTARVTLSPPVANAPSTFGAANMGNPHAVFFVDDLRAIDLDALGPQIETHPMFPEKVNTTFARILTRDRVEMKVWERGAGATLACGSAACATLVAGVRLGQLDRAATLSLPGGDLKITWREKDSHVLMTGPTEFEFERALDAAIFSQ